MILCAVQTIVKRNEREKQEDQQSEYKRGRNSPGFYIELVWGGSLCLCAHFVCFSRE